MNKEGIIRIAIKGESGYCCAVDAYNDKITITRGSIRYEYKPVYVSDKNVPRNWSYKTDSPVFQKLYDDLAGLMPEVLTREEIPFVTDIGATTFIATYADKSKGERTFFLPGDEFKDVFSIIKQMVPACEQVPYVIQTSENFEDREDD